MLPIALELAILLEATALLVPGGPAHLERLAAKLLTERALLYEGTEERRDDEVLESLFHMWPPILRCSSAYEVSCRSFLLDEDELLRFLRAWGGEPLGEAALGSRTKELETAVARRLMRWAGIDRPPEWTLADHLPEQLGQFLRRHVRHMSVAVRPESPGWYVIRMEWAA